MNQSECLSRIKALIKEYESISYCVLKISYDGIALTKINHTELIITSNSYLFFDEIEKEANPEFHSLLIVSGIKMDIWFKISKQLSQLRNIILKENGNKGKNGINIILEPLNETEINQS